MQMSQDELNKLYANAYLIAIAIHNPGKLEEGYKNCLAAFVEKDDGGVPGAV